MLPNSKATDPRVQRTRHWLQQALQTLLHEKDFNQITVQDITAKAGVNRATFYAHFEDKYALMNACILEQFQELIDKRLPTDAHLSDTHLRLLIMATCEFLRGFSGRCTPTQCQHHPPAEVIIQHRLYELLLRWLQQEVPYHRHYAPETAARAMAWAIFGSVWEWVRSRSALSVSEYADEILRFISIGLGQEELATQQ